MKYMILQLIAAVVLAKGVHTLHTVRKELAATKAELKEAKMARAAWERQIQVVVDELAICQTNGLDYEACRSAAAYTQVDLNRCINDRDVAIKYGIKCAKRNLKLSIKNEGCK